MNAEIEVLDDLLKHTRKLALTRDPRRRIEVSKWEIFFAEKLAEAERAEAARTDISVVNARWKLTHLCSFKIDPGGGGRGGA